MTNLLLLLGLWFLLSIPVSLIVAQAIHEGDFTSPRRDAHRAPRGTARLGAPREGMRLPVGYRSLPRNR